MPRSHPFARLARGLPLALALLIAACADPQLPTAAVAVPAAPQAVVSANAAELFISEVIEGSSNNKAIEIYNGTGASVDLTAGGYKIQMYFNGSPTAGLTITLTGTIAAGDVFVLAQSSAGTTILAQADQVNGSGWFNGDDAIVLVKGTTNTIVDAFGQVGFDPGTEWGTGLISTADNTLRRQSRICRGDLNATNPFVPDGEWDGFAVDTFGGLGAHTANCASAPTAPTVVSTVPANNATNVALASNVSITFSQPTTVTGAWYGIQCTTSGAHPAVVTGGPTTYTIDPTTDFAGNENCTVTLNRAQITDASGTVPMTSDVVFTFTTLGADVCAAPFTAAFAIQGAGAMSTLVGQTVTTQGVVTGIGLGGFFLQDVTGDGDAMTSDGLFVFSSLPVSVGSVVRVTGPVVEFGSNGTLTEIANPSSVIGCGTSSTVTPIDVALPLPSASFLERFEGMLVRLPQTLYVTDNSDLGEFGEVGVSSSARLAVPTNVVSPGPSASARKAQNALDRIRIDDGATTRDPASVFGRAGLPLSAGNTLRTGDAITGVRGPLYFGNGAYKVEPVGALGGAVPTFIAANPRPASPSVGGTLKVAALNVLNYFNSFSGNTCGLNSATNDCRGADNTAEFDRQAAKIVATIQALNADVIGLMEIENDGYGPSSSIVDLVTRVNAAMGAGTYAFVNPDATLGANVLGTDAIRVALLYKPGSVSLVGTTAVLNSTQFVNGDDPAPRGRPALTQAFQQSSNSARFIVTVNHFKSKGSACSTPDAGDGQGNCNAVRVNQANALQAWLATNPTGTGDPDVLIIGDLNAYAKEDPITLLRNAGYTDLLASFVGGQAYSYQFDGEFGYLDHALASRSLTAQVSGVAEWHVNADEPSVLDYNLNSKSLAQQASFFAADPFRGSDHDPVVVGLSLTPPTSVGPSVVLTPAASWTAGVAGALGVRFSGPNLRSAPFLVRINWGDGTPITQFASTVIPPAPILRSHVYAAAGPYTISVSVTDRAGTSATQTTSIQVQSK